MKRFLKDVALFLCPIALLVLFYAVLIEPEYQKGRYLYNEIGELGFVFFDENYNKSFTSPLEEYKVNRYRPETLVRKDDILTIGDSFSQKYNMGNDGYPNFLAYMSGRNVYNFEKVAYSNPFTHYQSLLSHNASLPGTVILECVECKLIERLQELDFNDTTFVYDRPFEDKEIEANRKSKKTLLENLHTYLDRMSDFYRKQFNSPVKHLHLDREVFTCKGKESDLYVDDETLPRSYSDADIKLVASKINELVQRTNEMGIRLIIVVPSDRYDFYYDYIVDTRYGKNNLLDDLSPLVDKMSFVNGKELLLPYRDAGIKDIYWANDTHWSPFASEMMARKLIEMLCSDSGN